MLRAWGGLVLKSINLIARGCIMAKAKYEHVKEFEISQYVKNYYLDISGAAFSIYQSMRFFEIEKYGYCEPVCIGFRDIAKTAHLAIGTVKNALNELQANRLLKVNIGEPGTKSKATQLTRIPIEHLKDHTLEGDTIHAKFAKALKEKGVLVDGKRLFPAWTIKQTNRIFSSKPHVQGFKKGERLKKFSTGAPMGSILISCDYKAAEPTIIKSLLKIDTTTDIYKAVMDSTSWERSKAKTNTNHLAYSRNTEYTFNTWPEQAKRDPVVMRYAEGLKQLKSDLAKDSQKTRSVTTLGGYALSFPKRQKPHPGKILNWKVQGTVADIAASAGLKLIQDKSVLSMVYLHDELIILFRPCGKTEKELSDYVQNVMQREAQKLNIPLLTSVKAQTL